MVLARMPDFTAGGHVTYVKHFGGPERFADPADARPFGELAGFVDGRSRR
jgi:hypothetical protein